MENANQNNARLEVIKASEIEPKEIEWLWYPFIPYGKVTLLQGDPGDGKSTFMLTIAALLTRGEPLPFTDTGKPLAPISIIYQTTEDDADDTIVPRFIKANGDRERLLFISEKESPLTFDDGRILSAIRETGARMLILDPLSSYIGDCQINAANEVRPRFNCLIRIAKETGCAIVIINHLNKMFGTKAIYRTPGSIDIVGAVRSALLMKSTKRYRSRWGNPSTITTSISWRYPPSEKRYAGRKGARTKLSEVRSKRLSIKYPTPKSGRTMSLSSMKTESRK